MSIHEKPFHTARRLVSLALFLLLFLSTSEASAQANHNVTRSNKTQPAAGTGVDNDCDGVCEKAPSLRGSLHVKGDSIQLFIDQEGRAPVPVQLVTAGDASTRAQDYNNSRSNRGTTASNAPTPTPARATDYNSSRSNKNGKSAVADGSLEHTDDWIAARAADLDPTPIYMSIDDAAFVSDPNPAFDIVFEPVALPQGRTSGVRQHAPFKVHAAFDAATPYLYKRESTQQLRFRVEGLAPGTYHVIVTDPQGREHRGHVTLLK